jgi:putative CocE/NonD family hydrolase
MLVRRICLIVVALAVYAKADVDPAYVRENYTKSEYRFPVRDGTKLFVSVYAPKDDSQKYPIVLTRTPYSARPYGEDLYPDTLSGPLLHYGKEKFIFVTADVRGRFGSEGTFVHMRPQLDEHPTNKDIDESTDAYDTIDWLVKHVPNNNGNVGMMGISYPGFYTAAGMIDSHPALKCASPQAPISDWFVGDDFHHNGAFFLDDSFPFLYGFHQKLTDPLHDTAQRFNFRMQDGYAFYLGVEPLGLADEKYLHGSIDFWEDLMNHGQYDEYWQSRNLRPHLKNVKTAVMTVGGWFDAEDLFGTLAVFRSVEKLNPDISSTLVMGPWIHGGWSRGDGDRLGDISFQAKTAQFYRDNIELPFLKSHLKGETPVKLPKAYVFETGTNQWRRYDAWPPRGSKEKTVYLQPDGALAWSPASAEGSETFISDPHKPVSELPRITVAAARDYMDTDQRFAARRPDVLTYETKPLEDDLTLSGPISVHLRVATSGTDSDWVAKVIDVYPNELSTTQPAAVELGGYQQLVRGDIFRGKFRNGYDKPEAFEPNKPADVNWVLPDINHCFRKGHRLMVQVQCTWFPLADINPQKFCDIYHAKPEDFQIATQNVYHGGDDGSSITVQVLPPAEAQ